MQRPYREVNLEQKTSCNLLIPITDSSKRTNFYLKSFQVNCELRDQIK